MVKRNETALRIASMFILVTILLSRAVSYAEENEDSILITLHADSTSVVGILNILADRSGLNIVTGPEVQGHVISIRLLNTPFENALNLVCRASGFGYEKIGNSILVADPRKLAEPTGIDSRVFDLHYADAADIRDVLEVINPEIKAEIRGNRLFMVAPKSAVEQAEQTISLLDRKPQQVLLESRLVEVNTDRLEELGIDWGKISKWTTVVTEGYHGASPPDQLPEEIDFTKIGSGDAIYRQMASFEVLIDLLITEGSARILTDSKIVTLDGEPAEIFSGETVRVVLSTLGTPESAGGVLQTLTLEEIDIGVILNITPRISGEGFITTLVEPEISRIVGYTGPNADLPQTATRRARSLVRVKDGQKIYLGGLITETELQTVKKVPLLGSIPLLGYFFQHKRTETRRTDMIIEITPRIVGDEGEALPDPVSLGHLIDGVKSQEENNLVSPVSEGKE